MEIKTFEDLIEWTRSLHAHLAQCMHHCASKNEETKARALLDFLASHEATLEKTVSEFERQGDSKALKTWIYDFLSHQPIKTHQTCDAPYAELDFNSICREIVSFHDQVIELYRNLKDRAEIPETHELVDSLLALEEHEAMRLSREMGRMGDV